MKVHALNSMIGGWFLGAFNPTCYDTKDFEIAIKRYRSGDSEPAHHHAIAREFSVIISGKVSMNGIIFEENSIIEVEPGEVVKFKALTDVISCVVKIPSCKGDKYLA